MEQIAKNLTLAFEIEEEWSRAAYECDLCGDRFHKDPTCRITKCPDCFEAAVEYRRLHSFRAPAYMVRELIS